MRPWSWATGAPCIHHRLVFSGEREERNLACVLLVPLSSLVSVSTWFVLGRRERAGATDGVIQGTGDGEHCGAGVYLWGCRGSRP
jgi:hypothetical protein